MPSLKVLQEFRTSFGDIGREKADLSNRGISYDELDLPDTEAVPMQVETPQDTGRTGAAGTGSGDFSFADGGGSSLNQDAGIAPDVFDADGDLTGIDFGMDSFDFGGLSDTAPADFGKEPDALGSFDQTDGNFNAPADLLSGFSDELEAGVPDLPDAENQTDISTSEPEFFNEPMDAGFSDGQETALPDLPEMPSEFSAVPVAGQDDFPFEIGSDTLDLGGESQDIDSGTQDIGNESLDLSGETLDLGGESLDLGGDNLDIGGESQDLSGESLDLGGESLDLGGENLDIGSDNLDLGGESLDLSGENFDIGGEALSSGSETDFDSDFESSGGGGTPENSVDELDGELLPADMDDSFNVGGDGFDMGGEAPVETSFADSFGAGESAASDSNLDFGLDSKSHDSGGDDFTLPGIDDLFQGSAPGSTGSTTKKSAAAAKQTSDSDEVEEIQLNNEQLERFNRTLSGYPLNLRIACEELIVEQAVAPDLMSKLIKMLINGASAKETAELAGGILNRSIHIPRGFQKSTGEAMEAEQASFVYIFAHKFLPMFRLFVLIAIAAFSVCFLIYKFIYIPLNAERIYKIGYERIFAGEYQRANERFNDAFSRHRKKIWFYRYAEAFRDERQYVYAEQKYDELLRYYIRDKKGVLDYAALETYYLRNYDKADRLLRRELLDYAPNDSEGLLALGDNSLAWGEIDYSKYEDARFAYARWLSIFGWKDPVVERMLKYFIRTDNLKEVLPLYDYFTTGKKRQISADSLAELGGYLLDKQLEEQRGVPNEYIERIEGVRPLLLRAIEADPSLPEAHYHLSRYYNKLGNRDDERITLERALKAFKESRQETIRRLNYRIDANMRYADILIKSREFFAAEESLVEGINLYEDALSRRLIARNPGFGRLYAGLGDLEYFTKLSDWEQALKYYHQAEQNGWAPPEILYRMGSAYYQLGGPEHPENWKKALEYFFKVSADFPLSRRLLFALGNSSYQRADYFASQAYFNRLLDILSAERSRLPVLLPNDRPEYLELAERLMMAYNNAGVVYEALAKRTGNQRYQARAMSLYAESSRAWDSLTRDPKTMIRSGSIPLPQLNSRNALYPRTNYTPEIFPYIDKDVLEPSAWEYLLAPR